MYRKALLTCALAVLSAARTGAQDVSGTLVDGGGAPVGAAVVVLVDSAGGRTSPVLTDAAGGFRLRAARPGRYRVRAERVGFATTFSAPLLLTAGQPASVRLVASSTPITLEGITVRAGNRCRIGDGSERGTAVLWEEARKALTAAEQAEAARALHYEFVSYHRELEPGSLAIRSEEA